MNSLSFLQIVPQTLHAQFVRVKLKVQIVRLNHCKWTFAGLRFSFQCGLEIEINVQTRLTNLFEPFNNIWNVLVIKTINHVNITFSLLKLNPTRRFRSMEKPLHDWYVFVFFILIKAFLDELKALPFSTGLHSKFKDQKNIFINRLFALYLVLELVFSPPSGRERGGQKSERPGKKKKVITGQPLALSQNQENRPRKLTQHAKR